MSQLLPVATGNTFELRPLNVRDLCGLYRVGKRTMYKWLEQFKDEIGAKHGYFYNIKQVHIIVSRLGLPGSVVTE